MNLKKGLIYVQCGEAWVSNRDLVLRTDGIGSCGAIVAYDKETSIGALSHIMLPGRSKLGNDSRYAEDAIEDFLFKMRRLGSHTSNIETCIVGCANVLYKTDDSICSSVEHSISTLLKDRKIKVVKKIVGGFSRRTASIEILEGKSFYSEGDNVEMLLYDWKDGII